MAGEYGPIAGADVGEVMFGDALTLSADQELEHHLWRVTGKPYVDIDIELESGCGIVPIEYKCRSRLHSLQWSAGLELLLATRDPWRLALSTDHPNGASFAAYPLLIAQLMSSALRRETLALALRDSRPRRRERLAVETRHQQVRPAVEVAPRLHARGRDADPPVHGLERRRLDRLLVAVAGRVELQDGPGAERVDGERAVGEALGRVGRDAVAPRDLRGSGERRRQQQQGQGDDDEQQARPVARGDDAHDPIRGERCRHDATRPPPGQGLTLVKEGVPPKAERRGAANPGTARLAGSASSHPERRSERPGSGEGG